MDALEARFEDLLLINGFGEKSARNLKSLAEAHGHSIREKVRVLPDPDRRRVADTPLLQSLIAFDEFRNKVEPELPRLIADSRKLEAEASNIRRGNGVVGLVFSKTKRRKLVDESAIVAKELNQFMQQVQLGLSVGDPTKVDPTEAWRAYQKNNSSFVAALEQSEGGVVVQVPPPLPHERKPGVRKPEAQTRRALTDTNEVKYQPLAPIAVEQTGGLPPELAARIEALHLLRGPLTASLRRYQEFGARFLAAQGRSILGDDMGLGKTVQVLAFMCHLHALGAKRFLVVAPNSLLINWQREVAKHSRLRPLIVHGEGRYTSIRDWSRNGGVAITTYGTVASLLGHIDAADLLVADEAHYVKNPEAKRSQSMRNLAAKASRVALLTGTAIENRLSEMGSLVSLANPAHTELIATLVDDLAPDPAQTRARLAPVYLRRTQKDVLRELPDRNEIYEWIELSGEDLEAYQEAEAEGMLMTVRQAAVLGKGTRDSAKMHRLTELLENYRSLGRKVVVFSFFRGVVELVAQLANGCRQIHGEIGAAERQLIIDRFSDVDGSAVLACQIDAGGLGLNIQAAQVVVLMEPQLKPSTESQAIARVHRMGQSRTVTVHRLVAKDTIEEWAIQLLAEKQEVFNNYADPSALKDVSAMAKDGSSATIEHDLGAMLVRKQGIRGRTAATTECEVRLG
jgi:superfamily II DNA or RNA helicase